MSLITFMTFWATSLIPSEELEGASALELSATELDETLSEELLSSTVSLLVYSGGVP